MASDSDSDLDCSEALTRSLADTTKSFAQTTSKTVAVIESFVNNITTHGHNIVIDMKTHGQGLQGQSQPLQPTDLVNFHSRQSTLSLGSSPNYSSVPLEKCISMENFANKDNNDILTLEQEFQNEITQNFVDAEIIKVKNKTENNSETGNESSGRRDTRRLPSSLTQLSSIHTVCGPRPARISAACLLVLSIWAAFMLLIHMNKKIDHLSTTLDSTNDKLKTMGEVSEEYRSQSLQRLHRMGKLVHSLREGGQRPARPVRPPTGPSPPPPVSPSPASLPADQTEASSWSWETGW